MKRVLHVVGPMDRAGSETFVMNCYRQTDRAAVQFDFVVISGAKGAYDAEIEKLGGRIYRIPHPKLRNPALFLRRLRRIIIEHGPYSAVHSHIYLLSGLVMYCARSAGIPVRIAHSHSTQDGRASRVPRRLYRFIMRLLIRRNATQLLGCSSEACRQLFGTARVNDLPVRVLRNGITMRNRRAMNRGKPPGKSLGYWSPRSF